MNAELSDSRCQQGEWVVKLAVHVGGEVGERDAHRSEALAGLAARQARRCVHGVMQDAHDGYRCGGSAIVDVVLFEFPESQILPQAYCLWSEFRKFYQPVELRAQAGQIVFGAFDAVFTQAVGIDVFKVGKRLGLDVKPHVRRGPRR